MAMRLPVRFQGFPRPRLPGTSHGLPGQAFLDVQGFLGFPRVFQGFPGVFRVSYGFPGLTRTSQGFPGFPRDSQGFSEFLRVSYGFPGLSRASLSSLCRAGLPFPGVLRVSRDFQRSFKVTLPSTSNGF